MAKLYVSIEDILQFKLHLYTLWINRNSAALWLLGTNTHTQNTNGIVFARLNLCPRKWQWCIINFCNAKTIFITPFVACNKNQLPLSLLLFQEFSHMFIWNGNLNYTTHLKEHRECIYIGACRPTVHAQLAQWPKICVCALCWISSWFLFSSACCCCCCCSKMNQTNNVSYGRVITITMARTNTQHIIWFFPFLAGMLTDTQN